jgi:4a-hydroxytetrahydrobiopterin dehydratase
MTTTNEIPTGWSLKQDGNNSSLERNLSFNDFRTAFSTMTKIADLAEAQAHHPWWSNVYNKIEIKLSTHDAGNVVTEKDHRLALAINALLEEL